MIPKTFFNAHHAPIGAFATFTFGSKGSTGGLGIELGGPANESIYIGVEERDRPGKYRALPFFATSSDSTADQDFDVEGLASFHRASAVTVFPDSEVTRTIGASLDEWKAGDLTFQVASPVRPIPDPDGGNEEELKAALAPAVYAEITIDNRAGKHARKAFFGFAGSDRRSGMRTWSKDGVTGIGQGSTTAIVTSDTGVYGGIAWQPEAILDPKHDENLDFLLGSLGMLVGTVPAGEVRTFRFAVCFYVQGTVTTGIDTRYLYRRWFESIESVASYALGRSAKAFEEAAQFDVRFAGNLNSDRAFMAAHALRSYYGSTQCLEREDGRPIWVVNEGEYRMMNTMDLTVDQSFLELALNPWTVRNVLDLYTERYSYEDKTRFPSCEEQHDGGIAFCHDMGIANNFSSEGRSGYEQSGLSGCFSFMSTEELVNWGLCACLYAHSTGDAAWIKSNREVFARVVRSLLNRDHPEESLRDGIMSLDSSRCEGGKEITTYDSLDASLGQARNNLYLAVKCWSLYVLLEGLLRDLGDSKLADESANQAARCASSLIAAEVDGSLPAVLGEGIPAKIIPAIEGLVYPLICGRPDILDRNGRYGDLIRALERHFDSVLKQGICLFPDGGWKLSSTSRNSWLSKIYLCQFVAEQVFGKSEDSKADRAHVSWLMDSSNAYYAWSDQMLEGKAVGSRYYPRGVTSALWISKPGEGQIRSMADVLTLGKPGVELRG